MPDDDRAERGSVDLYWIPLGAGAHVVRVSGKIFEACSAFVHRRRRAALFHSALVIEVAGDRVVVEMTPIPDGDGEQRGVVAEGPVGLRALGRWRLFRYEIHRWRDGTIPDIDAAVASPVRVSDDPAVTGRVLDLLPSIPTPVWGRDEQRTGDMWNSNSVVSWVLARSGIDLAHVRPPDGGRAPGWDAGVVVAGRASPRSTAGAATSRSGFRSP